jgi:hypothetical protein
MSYLSNSSYLDKKGPARRRFSSGSILCFLVLLVLLLLLLLLILLILLILLLLLILHVYLPYVSYLSNSSYLDKTGPASGDLPQDQSFVSWSYSSYSSYSFYPSFTSYSYYSSYTFTCLTCLKCLTHLTLIRKVLQVEIFIRINPLFLGLLDPPFLLSAMTCPIIKSII